MRKKLFNICNKIYTFLMAISFFGGLLPLFPFLFALIVGGPMAESISVFLYDKYFPWVIIAGSIAIIFGVIGMYIAKIEGLSVKSVSADAGEKKEETK